MNDQPGDAAGDLTLSALTARTLDDFLRTLAETAVARAPGCDGCGVTLQREDRPLTVASFGASARALDEKQYSQDDGPCLQSLRTGREVAVRDLRGESRWGAYPGFAVEHGTLSSLSLPVATDTRSRGALNLYAPVPDGFTATDAAALRALAAEATGAVALAERMEQARGDVTALPASVRERSVIDHAVGVVMAQHGCSPAHARTLLTRQATRQGARLVEVCSDVVADFENRPE
jgi:GAF domain-containing protein